MAGGGLVLGLVNSLGNHPIKLSCVCQHRLPHRPWDFLKLLRYPQHFFNCGTVCLQWAAQTIMLTESCHKQSFKVKQKCWNWNVCPKNPNYVLVKMKPLCFRATSTSYPTLSMGLSLSPVFEAILAWQLSLSDTSCEQCSISCSTGACHLCRAEQIQSVSGTLLCETPGSNRSPVIWCAAILFCYV